MTQPGADGAEVSATELRAIREAIGLFASVIKSGESWSPTCQAAYDAALPALVQLGALTARDAMIDQVANRVHVAWMAALRRAGVTSHKLETGEELMVPYAVMSEQAKELDRSAVRACLEALREFGWSVGRLSVSLWRPPHPREEDEHRERHELLHEHFDELMADFLGHNRGKRLDATLRELMLWSHGQTITPDGEMR